MKISKTHQVFSVYLKEPRALTNPEDYLGPNWQDVINFWLYLDGLSEEERKKIEFSYRRDLEYDLKKSARDAARSAAYDVVGGNYSALLETFTEKQSLEPITLQTRTFYHVFRFYVFMDATLELIAKQKLLEQGKTLVALPLCGLRNFI
jgi:hypothetical protein